jgi:Ulp1 family protease
MKKMAQFYQQEIKKQTSKHAQSQMKASITFKNDEANAIDQLREDNQRLNELLRQARDLITTKEEFIVSLSEENQELREELEKWRRPNLIRGSAESSLGYSATADKHPKKESSHEMGHIAERLNLALGSGDKREWDEFEEGSSDDINYS